MGHARLLVRPPAAHPVRCGSSLTPPLSRGCRVALALLAVLKWNIEWLLVDCVAIALSSANLYGYIKCKKGGSRARCLKRRGAASSAFSAPAQTPTSA